ncbi:MAG TPA: biotin/lipoyl-containing protein, partial [Streptosporangiaceae bacterium]
HAIEARLYAEDPAAGFLPATGTLMDWCPATAPPCRWDTGVAAGSVVGVEFDPMLAKVIAHAPARGEAALALALALQRSRIRGVTTNRDFLVAALRHPDFLAGRTTTSFIERSAVPLARRPSPAELRTAAIGAALAAQVATRAAAPVLATLPSGWRNSVMPPELAEYRHGSDTVAVSYARQRDGRFAVTVTGASPAPDGAPDSVEPVAVHHAGDGWIDFDSGGRRHRLHVLTAGDQVWVQGPDGDVALTAVPRFPESGHGEVVAGGLVAPMPGTVLAVHVAPGDTVAQGQLLMIVEAMKMEHRITAPRAGAVREVRARPGDQVNGGDLLAVLDDTP